MNWTGGGIERIYVDVTIQRNVFNNFIPAPGGDKFSNLVMDQILRYNVISFYCPRICFLNVPENYREYAAYPILNVAKDDVSLPPGSFDYLIITSEDLRQTFEHFAAFKESQGFKVHIATLQFINQHYLGNDIRERIVQFLRDAFNTWRFKYLLLGGTPEIVPSFNLYCSSDYPLPSSFDYYYMLLEQPQPITQRLYRIGTENLPIEQRLYAGFATADLPDIVVGRFPVETIEELKIMMSKTILFTAQKKTGKMLTVFGQADPEGNESFSTREAEILRRNDVSLTVLQHPYNCTSSSFIREVETSGFDAIYIHAHGDPYGNLFSDSYNATSGMMECDCFGGKEAEKLNNAVYPIVFNGGCSTGDLLLDDIRENVNVAWLLNPHGGAAACVAGPSLSPGVEYVMYAVYGVSEDEQFPSPDTHGNLGLALFAHCGLFPLDDNLILLGDPSLLLTTADYNDLKHIVADRSYVSDERASVGTVQTVSLHLKWMDGSDVAGGEVYVNGTRYVTNSTGWISFKVKCDAVGKQAWKITRINFFGITDFVNLLESDPFIIWDRVKILSFSASDERADCGSTQWLYVSAELEYDHTPLGKGDIIYVDGKPMIWDPQLGKFKLPVSSDKVAKKVFKITGVNETSHGITAFQPSNTSIIFDMVNLTLSVLDDRINVGSIAQIQASGVYAFDGSPWRGSYVLNDTLGKNVPGRYEYTVSSVTDDKYGLTVFKCNSVQITFDKILITLKVLRDKVSLWTEMPWDFTAVYASTGEDAKPYLTVNLNDTTTKSAPGTYAFTIQSIKETKYGLTAFESNTITCTWEIPAWIYGALASFIIAMLLIIIIKGGKH